MALIDIKFDNLDTVVRQIRQYRTDVGKKAKAFVDELSELGIEVARDKTAEGSHQMPKFIRFEKKIISDRKGYVIGVITGIGDTFPSDWVDVEGIEHIDDVYPLSMLEFGSAAFALPPQAAFGGHGGQGTFSVSGNENKSEWYVNRINEDGTRERRYATAIKPTRPMYNAMIEMQKEIESCARKAFGS